MSGGQCYVSRRSDFSRLEKSSWNATSLLLSFKGEWLIVVQCSVIVSVYRFRTDLTVYFLLACCCCLFLLLPARCNWGVHGGLSRS